MTQTPTIPLAVALKYEKPNAPRVIATGRGEIGRKIIDVARQNGIPLEKTPGLAVALSDVELGEEIPVELYRAVAEVLTFILRTSGKLR
jgi:flagellar biosynthesis protein